MDEKHGAHADEILRKIGLPPLDQMTKEQREDLRTALGLPTRYQPLSPLIDRLLSGQMTKEELQTELKARRDQAASAPKTKPLTITEQQWAALKWWLGLPVQTARRVSQLEEKDAKRSERARLRTTKGNRFREAIFQVLKRRAPHQ